jgi:hypothetical protein
VAKLPDDILTLRAAQREIAAERSFASPLLERYVVSAGRGFAGHLSSSNNGGSGTAAAFCALFLARSARAGYLAASEELLSSLTHQVRQTCLPALAKLAHGALADRADKTGLNNYKLPIYVAGVAALANLNLIESAEALTGIELGLKEIHERLNRDTAGALSRVGEYARKEPSAYHSYWAALALTESLSSSAVREKLTKDQGELRHLVSDLGLVRLWAEGALAALVADEHAGITSRFDPIELVCAASLTLLDRCDLAAPGHKPLILPPPSAEAVRLASHGLEILFNRHFSGGLVGEEQARLLRRKS